MCPSVCFSPLLCFPSYAADFNALSSRFRTSNGFLVVAQPCRQSRLCMDPLPPAAEGVFPCLVLEHEHGLSMGHVHSLDSANRFLLGCQPHGFLLTGCFLHAAYVYTFSKRGRVAMVCMSLRGAVSCEVGTRGPLCLRPRESGSRR